MDLFVSQSEKALYQHRVYGHKLFQHVPHGRVFMNARLHSKIAARGARIILTQSED